MRAAGFVAIGYPHHPAAAAAVVEEAAHRIRQVAGAGETAEVGDELTEGFDWHRRIERPAHGYADQAGDVRAQHDRRLPIGIGALDVDRGAGVSHSRSQRAYGAGSSSKVKPSCTSSMLSMATSLPVAFKVGPFDLIDPGVLEVPAHHRHMRLVLQHHAAVTAVVLAIGDALIPLPQGVVLGVAALEHQIGVLAQTHQLAHVVHRVGALAIVDGVAFGGEAAHLAEAGHRQAVDFDEVS